jgi:hypothetical protein
LSYVYARPQRRGILRRQKNSIAVDELPAFAPADDAEMREPQQAHLWSQRLVVTQ